MHVAGEGKNTSQTSTGQYNHLKVDDVEMREEGDMLSKLRTLVQRQQWSDGHGGQHVVQPVEARASRVLRVSVKQSQVRGKGESVMLRAFEENAPRAVLEATRLLPASEDVSIILDAMMDPVSQLPYSLCFHVHLASAPSSSRGYSRVTLHPRAEGMAMAAWFALELSDVLYQYSFGVSNATVQVYTWDSTMRTQIQELLYRASEWVEDGDATQEERQKVRERAWYCLLALVDDATMLRLPVQRDVLEATNSGPAAKTNAEILEALRQEGAADAPATIPRGQGKVFEQELYRERLRKLRPWAEALKLSMREADGEAEEGGGNPPPQAIQIVDKLTDATLENATLDRLKDLFVKVSNVLRSALVCRPPAVAAVKDSIIRLVCIPEPGFYTLEGAVKWLGGEGYGTGAHAEEWVQCAVSSDRMYTVWRHACMSCYAQPELWQELQVALAACAELRGELILRVLEGGRRLVQTQCEQADVSVSAVFVEKARPLVLMADTRLQHEHLRRLVFMKGYERVLELQGLRSERFCKTRTPKVQYIGEAKKEELPADVEYNKYFPARWFKVVDGAELVKSSERAGMAQWMLFPVPGVGEQEACATFDDMAIFNRFSVGMMKSAERSAATPPLVRLVDVLWGPSYDGRVLVRAYCNKKEFWCKAGSVGLLRRRYIDFNTDKVIQHLMGLDVQCREAQEQHQLPLFVRIIDNPSQEAANAAVGAGPAAILKASDALDSLLLLKTIRDVSPSLVRLAFDAGQNRAFDQLRKRRIQLTFGGPGCG